MTPTKMRTFYFNTGVSYSKYPGLGRGQILSGDAKVIPFDCENVPDRATFAFACDNPNLPEADSHIVREMYNTTMLSKYAYFIK